MKGVRLKGDEIGHWQRHMRTKREQSKDKESHTVRKNIDEVK